MSFRKEHKIYQVFQKGELVAEGTIRECAQMLNLKPQTIVGYATPGQLAQAKLFPDVPHAKRVDVDMRLPGYIAVYEGDRLVTMGTVDEVKQELDVSEETLAEWSRTRAYTHGMIVIGVDWEDDNE